MTLGSMSTLLLSNQEVPSSIPDPAVAFSSSGELFRVLCSLGAFVFLCPLLITLSRRTAICLSVAELKWTGGAPLGAVSHRFNF